MLLYSIIVTAVLFCLFLISIWNLYLLRKRTYCELSENTLPFISVLIPARNEEHNIKKVLNSLIEQNYPKYEIIVLDDNSEDKTFEIADSLAQKHSHVKVIKGEPLAEGWTGKSYACHQLYLASTGNYLLYTDADTVHSRDSLKKSISLAIKHESDLLTLMPKMTMKTLSEKIIMPMLYFTVMNLLPFYFVNRKGFINFSIGIGPFMLFKRSAYEKIGGHKHVRSELVEDVVLAKNIKKNGLKLTVLDGKEILSVRMYRNLREIWEGFSKNIFAGFGFSTLWLLVTNLIYLVLFFLPFIFLSFQLFLNINHKILLLTALQITIIYLSRLLISIKFSLGLGSVIFQPLGTLAVNLISFNSWRWIYFSKGSMWKGRIYQPKLK